MGLFGRLFSGKNGEGSQPDQAGRDDAAPAGDYSDLDPRVSTLLSDFEQRRFGLGPTGTVDYATCRDAVLDLHSEVTDEPSRIALLRFHNALMSSGVQGLQREGRDPSALEAMWSQDYYSMLTREVIGADGQVDQQAVDELNRREKAAGRMAEGDMFQVQQTAAPEPEAADGPPSARRVGERAIALWTVVLCSIAPEQRKALVGAFASEGSRDWLTEAERSFLLNDEPDQKDMIMFGWQAERLIILSWALGLADLPAHDARCDPLAFATLLPPTAPMEFEAFLGGLRLRDPLEIETAAADINQSYWAANEAEAAGLPMPQGTDIDILDERIRAVAWLLGQKVPEWP